MSRCEDHMPALNTRALTVLWDNSEEDLRRKFNQSCFSFRHQLAGHPLFTIDRLLALARESQLRPGDVYFDAGDVRVEQKWGTIPVTGLTVEQTLHRIETAGAWVIMKHVELDPEYGAVLREHSEQILRLAEKPFRKALKNPEMLVIINSPNRITPFHIDGEVNFLLQVRGSKTIRIFDRNDRVSLTEEEIERFYTVDGFSANYKEGIDSRAELFELTPGQGVHIPVNCPHWVQNGPEVSISVSVNFELPDEMRADLYRMNHLLRRTGIRPSPPGRFPWRDKVKTAFYRAYRTMRSH